MKSMSRMEMSKVCRRVLSRHAVDLGQCQYMCSGHEIRLTGVLIKTSGDKFHTAQVQVMIEDFQKFLNGIRVYGELDNWKFTSDAITKADPPEDPDANKKDGAEPKKAG